MSCSMTTVMFGLFNGEIGGLTPCGTPLCAFGVPLWEMRAVTMIGLDCESRIFGAMA